MQDPECRFVRRRGAQRDLELCLVGIGHRQTENAMPVPVRDEGVDQRSKCVGIIADHDPGRSFAGRRI